MYYYIVSLMALEESPGAGMRADAARGPRLLFATLLLLFTACSLLFTCFSICFTFVHMFLVLVGCFWMCLNVFERFW